MPVIRPKDVDYWFKHSHLTLKPNYHYKSQFNSFVAPGPKHTIQVDLFNFKYEQEQPDFESPPPPHGIIGIDVFTKQAHVVPVSSKRAEEWERAVNEIVGKLGRPKIIMTDPDSSMTGVVLDEWFRKNKDVKFALTRHHAAFAERALRMFKV